MARARNIKPGFWTNEHVVELTPWARLLFIGLWAVADREGRLEDRPKRIKMEIFPADTVDVEALLREIEGHGLIRRYSVNGSNLVWIPGFKEHQNPHKNEKNSEFPPHPDDNIATLPEHSRNEQSDPADSLNTDSLNPETTTPKPPPGDGGGSNLDDRFDRFWHAYPRKVAKDDARRRWGKIKPSEQLLAEMLAALEWQRRQHDWTKDNGQFIPYPASWLNKGQWANEPTNITPMPELPGQESWRNRKAQF